MPGFNLKLTCDISTSLNSCNLLSNPTGIPSIAKRPCCATKKSCEKSTNFNYYGTCWFCSMTIHNKCNKICNTLIIKCNKICNTLERFINLRLL